MGAGGAGEAGDCGERQVIPADYRMERDDVSERMVITMPFGKAQGMGFGFRSNSPAWPYVGRGRGGLPRCWAFGSYALYGGRYPAHQGQPQCFGGGTPFAQPSSPDQEVAFLKNQAATVREQLNTIEARLKELETVRRKGEG